jgi:hypothetical protein
MSKYYAADLYLFNSGIKTIFLHLIAEKMKVPCVLCGFSSNSEVKT